MSCLPLPYVFSEISGKKIFNPIAKTEKLWYT